MSDPLSMDVLDVLAIHDFANDKLNRNNHNRVLRICQTLRDRGLKVWQDEDQSFNHDVEKLRPIINSSQVAIIFITENYIEKVKSTVNLNDGCKTEFKYISKVLINKMIPVVMEPHMLKQKWTGPVGIILGSDKFIDFSLEDDIEYDNKINYLYTTIKTMLTNQSKRKSISLLMRQPSNLTNLTEIQPSTLPSTSSSSNRSIPIEPRKALEAPYFNPISTTNNNSNNNTAPITATTTNITSTAIGAGEISPASKTTPLNTLLSSHSNSNSISLTSSRHSLPLTLTSPSPLTAPAGTHRSTSLRYDEKSSSTPAASIHTGPSTHMDSPSGAGGGSKLGLQATSDDAPPESTTVSAPRVVKAGDADGGSSVIASAAMEAKDPSSRTTASVDASGGRASLVGETPLRITIPKLNLQTLGSRGNIENVTEKKTAVISGAIYVQNNDVFDDGGGGARGSGSAGGGGNDGRSRAGGEDRDGEGVEDRLFRPSIAKARVSTSRTLLDIFDKTADQHNNSNSDNDNRINANGKSGQVSSPRTPTERQRTNSTSSSTSTSAAVTLPVKVKELVTTIENRQPSPPNADQLLRAGLLAGPLPPSLTSSPRSSGGSGQSTPRGSLVVSSSPRGSLNLTTLGAVSKATAASVAASRIVTDKKITDIETNVTAASVTAAGKTSRMSPENMKLIEGSPRLRGHVGAVDEVAVDTDVADVDVRRVSVSSSHSSSSRRLLFQAASDRQTESLLENKRITASFPTIPPSPSSALLSSTGLMSSYPTNRNSGLFINGTTGSSLNGSRSNSGFNSPRQLQLEDDVGSDLETGSERGKGGGVSGRGNGRGLDLQALSVKLHMVEQQHSPRLIRKASASIASTPSTPTSRHSSQAPSSPRHSVVGMLEQTMNISSVTRRHNSLSSKVRRMSGRDLLGTPLHSNASFYDETVSLSPNSPRTMIASVSVTTKRLVKFNVEDVVSLFAALKLLTSDLEVQIRGNHIDGGTLFLVQNTEDLSMIGLTALRSSGVRLTISVIIALKSEPIAFQDTQLLLPELQLEPPLVQNLEELDYAILQSTTFPDDHFSAVAVFDGLSVLLQQDQKLLREFREKEGYLANILGIFRLNIEFESVCKSGLVALKHLCRYGHDISHSDEENIHYLVLDDIGSVLVSILSYHNNHTDVLECSLRLIYVMAVTNDARSHLLDTGVCEYVVILLEKYNSSSSTSSSTSTSMAVVELACAAVRNLAVYEPCRSRMIGCGVCATLVEVLRGRCGISPFTREHVCVAIRCLAVDREASQEFAHHRVGEPLSVILKSSEPILIAHVCWAIRNLSTLDANRVQLGDCGVCEAVVSAIRIHMAVPAVAEQGCRVIASLAVHERNRGRLGDCGACEVTVGVLRKYSGVSEICDHACTAINHLLWRKHVPNRQRFVAAGLKKLAFDIIYSNDERDQPLPEGVIHKLAKVCSFLS